MKRLLYIPLLLVILLGCNAEQESTDMEKAYDMMVTAEQENRELTEEEDAFIKEFLISTTFQEKDKELIQAIEAMHFNFGAGGYEHAKETAESLMQ